MTLNVANMKGGTISISDLDFDYKLWKNQITFHKQQIKLYHERILELKSMDIDELNLQNLIELELAFHSLELDLADLHRSIVIQEKDISQHATDYPIDHMHEHFEAHELIQLMKSDINDNLIELEYAFEPYRL